MQSDEVMRIKSTQKRKIKRPQKHTLLSSNNATGDTFEFTIDDNSNHSPPKVPRLAPEDNFSYQSTNAQIAELKRAANRLNITGGKQRGLGSQPDLMYRTADISSLKNIKPPAV